MLAFPLAVAASFGADFRIEIDSEERFQTIEGFGCSINAWTAPFYQLWYDDDFARFVVEDLGKSVFRLQMWGGISPDRVADWREIDYQEFKWRGEGLRGKANVDWAKRLVDLNSEVKIIGSVWSPPAWMKENNSRTGTRAGYLLSPDRDYDHDNRLRDDHYRHFAKWIVEWARYMESQGTPFYAISLQNELLFTQWFESVIYTPEEYARLIRVTGEMFESEGVRKPLLFGPEDMTSATYADAQRHRPYIDAILNDPEVSRHFDALATHGYTDGVHDDREKDAAAYWQLVEHLGLPYWITEGGSGGHDWPAPVISGIAPRLHQALVRGNVSLFTGWQLASEAGSASSHEFMNWRHPTPKTYATMQFWQHIRPGAVRVGVRNATYPEGLLVSAYRHDLDRTAVTVLINQAEEAIEVDVVWGDELDASEWKVFQTSEHHSHEEVCGWPVGEGLRVRLPALSVTTVLGTFSRTVD